MTLCVYLQLWSRGRLCVALTELKNEQERRLDSAWKPNTTTTSLIRIISIDGGLGSQDSNHILAR
jgi:hypothetical protein